MALQLYHYVPGKIILIGKQPDGDSVRFIPDDPHQLDDIYRAHLLRPSKDGSHQLRLEGIDTPETHYEAKAQPLGDTARDEFLKKILHFSAINFAGETVKSSNPDRMEAAIFTASADVHGRPIAYLTKQSDPFDGDPTGAVSVEILGKTCNLAMIESGLAYPMMYSSTPADHRTVISAEAKKARDDLKGVWKVDKTERFALEDLASVGWKSNNAPSKDEEVGEGATQLVYPKLFRRACDFLKSGKDDLVDWLKATSAEDDQVIVDGKHEVPLSRLVRRENDRYRFDIDLTEAVFIEK